MAQKKVLFVATTLSHIVRFHTPYLQYFKDKGYVVHVAASVPDEDRGVAVVGCDKLWEVPFSRSFGIENVAAFRALKTIIQREAYAMIHCHTPIGAALTRLAAISARKKGTAVLYTCHGFYFHKDGSVGGWLLFYPIERMLSAVTDCLLTMNREDYVISQRFHAKRIEKINGIGVDIEKFERPAEDKQKNRQTLGLSADDFVLCYVADLKTVKRQEFLIHAVYQLKRTIPNVKLLLVGRDLANGTHQKLVETYLMNDYVLFTGERHDIPEILNATDVYVTVSTREGLATNVIEAFSAGKPVVATDTRGHYDLITHGVNGFLFDRSDEDAFLQCVQNLYEDNELRETIGEHAKACATAYSIGAVKAQMVAIYDSLL